MTGFIPYRSLVMIRDHMTGFPLYDLPAGYALRTYQPGDDLTWARIEHVVDEFETVDDALQRFGTYFGGDTAALASRCFFLTDAEGTPVGTASAWFRELDGEPRGEVAWVGILPAHQGKGLGKPLLSAVMTRLAQDHDRVWLGTQTPSYRAVNLYLDYGFVPYVRGSQDEEGWQIIERLLNRTVLSAVPE